MMNDNPIKTRAHERGLNIKELAILASMDSQRVYHICQHRVFPTADDVTRLATALGCEVLDLSMELFKHHTDLKEALRTRLQEIENND